MLSLSKCRAQLGDAGKGLSDSEVEALRASLYALAEGVLDAVPTKVLARGVGAEGRVGLVHPKSREEFEERAAILEFDAGFSRRSAETAAHAQLSGRLTEA